MPSLDSLSFDAAGLQYHGEHAGRRLWFTPDGDGIGLYLFLAPPDLPAGATFERLRDFHAASFAGSSNQLVSLATLRLSGGYAATRLIVKAPHPDLDGPRYLGVLTVPFRDFSFVIRVLCDEREPTGEREAVLRERARREGRLPAESDGWSPYDEGHDAEFPEHPLSRLRRILHGIEDSLVLDPDVIRQPRFELPAPLAECRMKN